MRAILSNAFNAPSRRRSNLVWLLRDLGMIGLSILGILAALGLLWALLVATP